MKIINIDVDSELIVKNVYDTESKEEKNDSNSLKIPTGNYKTIMLNFNFISPKFEEAGLKLFASFNNDFLDKPVMAEVTNITENKETYEHACYIPEELLRKTGKVKLGLFGYILNEETQELEKRYSLKPISSEVVLGSFQEDMINAATPTPTVFELYFQQVKDMADQVANDYELVRTAIENVKNENITDFNKTAEAKKTSLVSAFDKHAAEKEEEVKGNIDTHVATKIGEYDEHADDLIGSVADTRDELERVKNEVLETGEASGSHIHLEDSAMAEIQELSIDGTHKQITTEGKQILNANSFGADARVILSFKNDVLIAEGTESSTAYNAVQSDITESFKTNPGKALYFNYEDLKTTASPNGAIVQLSVFYNDGTKTLYYAMVTADKTKRSYMIPNDTSNIESVIIGIYTSNSETVIVNTITITKPMLTFDENAEYEPYTGLQPSPSPEYPQEIEVVEGTIQNKFVDKNILDYNNIRASVNGLTNVINEDGSITTTGIPTANNASLLTIDITNMLEDGETYNFSMGVPNKFVYIQLIRTEISSEKKNYVSIQSDTLKHYTFKVDKSQYTYVAKIVTPLLSDWGTESLTITNTYQLEKAPVSTEFEPYQENNLDINLQGNFMAKNGDIADTLRVENGRAILTKKIGKFVPSSKTNIVTVSSPTQNNSKFYAIDGTGLKAVNNNLVSISSNIFTGKTANGLWNSDVKNYCSVNVNGSVHFRVDSSLATIEDVRQFLIDNNVYFMGTLAEPYEVDLGEVDMPITYDEITNIFATHDLQPNINVKYYRDFIKTVQNLQVNEKALKQELIDINSRLSALENSLAASTNEEVESEVVE